MSIFLERISVFSNLGRSARNFPQLIDKDARMGFRNILQLEEGCCQTNANSSQFADQMWRFMQ